MDSATKSIECFWSGKTRVWASIVSNNAPPTFNPHQCKTVKSNFRL